MNEMFSSRKQSVKSEMKFTEQPEKENSAQHFRDLELNKTRLGEASALDFN